MGRLENNLGRSRGFPAIESPDAKVLILGSLPGIVSIKLGQYYAHPRNTFWAIMEAVLGIPIRSLPYEQRAAALVDRKIALWDVLAGADRPHSSLDADIKDGVLNDFSGFSAAHPALRLICFNGQKAAALYRKSVPNRSSLECVTLPSTSPAHAVAFETKLNEWAVIRRHLDSSNV